MLNKKISEMTLFRRLLPCNVVFLVYADVTDETISDSDQEALELKSWEEMGHRIAISGNQVVGVHYDCLMNGEQ